MEQVEAVMRAWQLGVAHRLRGDLPQALGEVTGVGRVDHGVAAAVDDEERRRVRPGERRLIGAGAVEGGAVVAAQDRGIGGGWEPVTGLVVAAKWIGTGAPEGIDVALDVVAGGLVSEGLPLPREGGRWVAAGALGGYDVAFDARRLYLHNAQMIGSAMRTPRHFGLLMDLARRAEVQPVIAAAFPLEQAALAQEALARREHVGKIVLRP